MPKPLHHFLDPAAIPAELRDAAVAIGNFDGVHLGHQALLGKAVGWSRAHESPALLLTFAPHPRRFFRPQEPFFQLTPPPLKAQRIAAAGLDAMVTMTFDASLAALSAESFIDDLLVKRLGARHVVVGYDFHFGRNRSGTTDMLVRRGAELGLTASIVQPVTNGGAPVSSSRIRALLAAGDIGAANALLGWKWTLSAVVQHGDKRGRELGYPTANLHIDPDTALAHGIYAVWATVDGERQAAVASFGRRPTFDGGDPKLEVHLFDFSGDLYGREMQVTFISHIRPELKFDSIDALIARMDQDSLMARQMLAAHDGARGTLA